MTNPAPVNSAQSGWRQMGGGYVPGGADNPQVQQQQQAQQQQPFQQSYSGAPPDSGTLRLPPQMQQAPQDSGFMSNLPIPQAPGIAGYDRQPQVQQQAPAQPPQQQFQQVPQGMDPNMRLSGPGIPAELQGRTLAEGIALYNGLRNVSTQLMAQVERQAVTAAPATPAPAPQAQPPGQADGEWDWRNPRPQIRDEVNQAVQAALQPIQAMLQPMVQQNAAGAVAQARDAAAREFGPDWASIEPAVMQQLQGADAATLSNPRSWQIAARAIYGDLVLQQRRMPATQQPGAYPAQHVPAGHNPSPNLNSFFTEQPTQGGPGAQGTVTLTPMEEWAMNAMGMSRADYTAWRGAQTGGGR